MRDFLKIKKNFLEEIFVRLLFLFLIIVGLAIFSVIFEKYSIFLKILPFLISILVIYILVLIFYNRDKIQFKANKIDYFIILFILLFSIFNAFYFSEALIEGGHDQGGYFETSLLLSKTGSYYENASARPISLSMPGYLSYENNLTRWHFLPGGPTYFSLFNYFFGINGAPIALAFSLFFSVCIIYFLCKRIRNKKLKISKRNKLKTIFSIGNKTGFLFVLFFLFNYYTIYFSRATWVENIQLLLVWFYIYLFVKGYQKKDLNHMIYAFLPLSLLMLFRLEAMLFVFVYFVVFSYFALIKRKKFKGNFSFKTVFVILFGLLIIASPFIFDLGGMLFDNSSPMNVISGTIKNPGAKIAWGPEEFVPYNQQTFIWTFLVYLFGLPFLLILLFGILNFFIESKETKKIILLISTLILPQFIFLIRPSIALYLPWASRRFWGAFFPYVFLLFSLFLTNTRWLFKKNFKLFSVIFISLMFVLSSLPGISIAGFKNGDGILEYEKEVASNFNQTDLVIFWDKYVYEKWGPPLYFLYGTNVAFDRPPSFDREIYALFMRDYKDIYIATSIQTREKIHEYFDGHLEYVKTLESPAFKVLDSAVCDVRRYNAYPETFEGYHQIRELCTKDNPPTKKLDYNISLNIYKINNLFREQFIDENYDPSYKITRQTGNIWH